MISTDSSGYGAMPDKEYNRVLETYLTDGYLRAEEWEAMSDLQQTIIQAIKRARKRLKARQ